MATCRKCLHAPVCFDSEGNTKYYGPDIAANNVEDLCETFLDRSSLVIPEGKTIEFPRWLYTPKPPADMRIELALPESKTMEFKRWTYKDGEDG